MRKAITTLQSCARLKEGAEEAEVTGSDVREMSGVVPDKWIGAMVDVCKKNSFEKMQVCVLQGVPCMRTSVGLGRF